ncbi:hypothetical protein [uncultured Bifidobacterium sp.]|uniref:hypothetical protein n=1 Tax=uncultured Bifidobacterium sp. TaxID=165187 RepID=UPI0027DC5157|nr:hypothetical protein [uncultured Bifidobacterium sp.]
MTGIDSPGNASTLSILIDESGDMYAPYRIGSMTDRYYLFALVFHDQTVDTPVIEITGFLRTGLAWLHVPM